MVKASLGIVLCMLEALKFDCPWLVFLLLKIKAFHLYQLVYGLHLSPFLSFRLNRACDVSMFMSLHTACMMGYTKCVLSVKNVMTGNTGFTLNFFSDWPGGPISLSCR